MVTTFIFKNKLIYLVALGLSCTAACELLVAACGIYFPDQESNLGPLLWELNLKHWTVVLPLNLNLCPVQVFLDYKQQTKIVFLTSIT